MLLTYVLPVHNEAAILRANVERLSTVLATHPGSSITLVENGSRDESAAVAVGLATESGPVPVRAFSLPEAGIGYAYHRGVREALLRDGPQSTHWLVLTAADLPFGSSDLDSALPHLEDPAAPLLIGSKAHPRSVVHVSRQRAAASRVYRVLRWLVAGMRTGDSQGSLFLRQDVAATLVPLVSARDYFYSTELVFHAERLRRPIVELPVTVAPEQRSSTVRPVRDGSAMLLSLVRTAKRWGRI